MFTDVGSSEDLRALFKKIGPVLDMTFKNVMDPKSDEVINFKEALTDIDQLTPDGLVELIPVLKLIFEERSLLERLKFKLDGDIEGQNLLNKYADELSKS